MHADREYFYDLVNKVPEAKLTELRKALLIMAMPEEEVTEEELEAIKQAKMEYENGEFTTYTSFGELEREFLND